MFDKLVQMAMLTEDGGDGFGSTKEIVFVPFIIVKVRHASIEAAAVIGFLHLLHESRPLFICVLLCKRSLDLSVDGTGSLHGANNKLPLTWLKK